MSRKEVNEEIIKELENKVIELDNEKNERDSYFQNFYDEMINMMVIFEQKTQKIIKMQNYNEHPQKRLEINTGNEIYESNIRSKSKNKISPCTYAIQTWKPARAKNASSTNSTEKVIFRGGNTAEYRIKEYYAWRMN